MTNDDWNRLNPGIPMPYGLRDPWRWVEPNPIDLVKRLKEAADLNVNARERENLCNVAADRIADLENRLTAMTKWLEMNQNDVWRRGIWDAIHGRSAGAGG